MQKLKIILQFMACAYHLQEDKHSHKGILLEAAKNVYVRA